MTVEEERHLRVMVAQAFDVRDTPYIYDACRAIAEWWDRRTVIAWENEADQRTIIF